MKVCEHIDITAAYGLHLNQYKLLDIKKDFLEDLARCKAAVAAFSTSTASDSPLPETTPASDPSPVCHSIGELMCDVGVQAWLKKDTRQAKVLLNSTGTATGHHD